MKYAALAILIIFINLDYAISQEYHETVQHTAQFTNATYRLISVHNVYGSIEIIGYDGANAMIEVDKSIKARSQRGLDNAKEELDVKVVEQDGVILTKGGIIIRTTMDLEKDIRLTSISKSKYLMILM